MTETSDIQQITKSLSQIITALNDLVGKSTPSLVQPPPVRVRKTADMTYHDYLEKVLANRSPVEVVTKQSYNIQEDLTLLLQLSKFSTITQRSFEEIAEHKRLLRPVESLRARYNDYLNKIQEPEMKKIVAWVQREGLEGYLSFEDKELIITHTDPREVKKEEKTEKADKTEKKRARNPSLESGQKKYERKTAKESKEGKKPVPTNCKELNDILKIYSKMVNIPVKTLLERLDQVSGDFIQLDNYIETKDNKLLWSAEEDEVLRKGGVQVEMLKRYRGAAVEARKKYLGII